MIQTDCKIISKKIISQKYILMTIESKAIAQTVMPGQFVMIKIPGDRFFLRRPISICKVNTNSFDIVFKVLGAGTEVLGVQDEGAVLNIIGPLGQGYPFIEKPKSPFVFMAGGTGIASLYFMAQCSKNLYKGNLKPVFFIGAKTKEEVLFTQELEQLGYEVIISTDDGSLGYHGFIPETFQKWLSSKENYSPSCVFACGPKLMLKSISQICEKNNLLCYVSMEERMACGIGACMGCVVKTRDKKNIYKRACKDGPVFNAKEIIFSHE